MSRSRSDPCAYRYEIVRLGWSHREAKDMNVECPIALDGDGKR